VPSRRLETCWSQTRPHLREGVLSLEAHHFWSSISKRCIRGTRGAMFAVWYPSIVVGVEHTADTCARKHLNTRDIRCVISSDANAEPSPDASALCRCVASKTGVCRTTSASYVSRSKKTLEIGERVPSLRKYPIGVSPFNANTAELLGSSSIIGLP